MEEMKKIQTKYSKLETENVELRKTIEKNRQDFDNQKQFLLSTKDMELVALNSNLSAIEGKHENNVNTLKRRLIEEEKKNADNQLAIEDLKELLQAKDKEIENMDEEKNKALSNLRQQMSKDKESVLRTECERIYKDKNKQIDELRERITHLEEKLLKEDIQSKKVEQMNQSLKNRVEELKNDVIELQPFKEQYEKKSVEYDRVYRHCLKYKTKMDSLKTELYHLMDRSDRLETSIKYLRDENAELRKHR